MSGPCCTLQAKLSCAKMEGTVREMPLIQRSSEQYRKPNRRDHSFEKSHRDPAISHNDSSVRIANDLGWKESFYPNETGISNRNPTDLPSFDQRALQHLGTSALILQENLGRLS